MKTILFADDTVLVQSDNNLGKLQNSVNHEMTKVMDWLNANKLSLNISKTKYMVITNKHVSTESFVINVNRNRIERTVTYKYLGVTVDEKLTWKEHCKEFCSTISKYVGVMYKVKHYVNNHALRMLYHSLINSRAQYGILAWGKAASCHLQPISVVLNRAMRCLVGRQPTRYSYLDFGLKISSFLLSYQRPSSSADCARELFKGSNGSASLVDCTRKKIFWLGGADFLWPTS